MTKTIPDKSLALKLIHMKLGSPSLFSKTDLSLPVEEFQLLVFAALQCETIKLHHLQILGISDITVNVREAKRPEAV